MDTKPLERFATQARRDLIAAVDAQATAVLAPGSVARSERGHVVRRLEEEIVAHGRPYVIDKVAYTWFNRIIALRFMDARGYTDAGVVSPAQGQSHGQPEILADAKRGNLVTDVVTNKNTAAEIIGLLDGTRRSTDAEGEAYALLLTEYCRYWHKSMPFMFEAEGDFTELLVPTGLLADGAILSRAREVLTEDVCDDVEVIGWVYQFYISERKDEVFAGFKKNKKAGAEEIPAATQLFTPHWIVRYLVENSVGRLWMLNNPASRLLDQMDYYIAPVDEETDFLRISGPEELTVIDPACGSGHMLTYAFDLLYSIYEEQGYEPSGIPSLILNHNLHGTEIDPRAGSLAAFALTMKARAKDRRFFSKDAAPKICVIEPIVFAPDELDFLVTPKGDRHEEEAFWNEFEHADTLGSLIRPQPGDTSKFASHLETVDDRLDLLSRTVIERASGLVRQAQFLAARYAVVVANPPYMSSGNMSELLSDVAKKEYPSSKANLYAMFIERSFELGMRGSIIGMITMESWMFLGSYVALRSSLQRTKTLLSMAHLGAGAFDSISGEVVATSAFVVLNASNATSKGAYVRLVEARDEAAKATVLLEASRDTHHPHRFSVDPKALGQIPGGIYAYWLQKGAVNAFSLGTVGDHARSEGAVKTGDNSRFLRKHWEVNRRDIGARAHWRLHPKGGGFRRWFGNVDTVVEWSAAARTHYRKDRIARIPAAEFWELAGITWSSVSTTRASFRILETDEVANNAALFIFLDDESRTYPVLGYLNSRFAAEYLEAVAPTINYLVGDIMALPLPEKFVDEHSLGSNVATLVDSARDAWNELEISASFGRLPLLIPGAERLEEAISIVDNRVSARNEDMRELELANDVILTLTFGHVASPLRDNDDSELSVRGATRTRHVLDFVSYAIGCMFGRYSLDEPGLIVADQGATLQDYLESVPSPTYLPDADNVIPFVDDGWFEDDIVERIRQFLRAAFGVQHFEENLRFVEESLGVKTLRDYFITKSGKSEFYEDHVQRYKKRPIYWMFSSPKGSFNALIYMHRYSPSTVSTVLNEYLREYRAKLEVALTTAEQAAAAGSATDQKESDRLRKVLAELRDYEHDVLYPLATQQIAIDLDDGVKVNYPKFYPAVKKIAGLEVAE
ncbi:BREX-1 system adenine-specific DNA-methyltransferase PglX [Salinibacterium sp. SWN1162]|uniref:BREX-1 system adenine-specific DNA-methyltransferase PglX n=1 Tax=Salinibacterium sp. SWN1162 TaxID=2792053 RepID=UPI0018CD0164|nr:BREX-1 system adenine-specific DNA-methyltransferase PglX [Salinibacterium sp. SWN1162]MBH0009576.1 BREX-1 system adenine-specific DNA-methyltransferase PglX [Salinibacterium sp. SWN1162]